MESKVSDETFAHAQDDLNPHFLRMLEGTFFDFAGQLVYVPYHL